jgi:DNA-binding MarR family transcriptional regulator
MPVEQLDHIRRLSQHYAYTSIQMHEAIGRKAGLPGTDHKYLGFLLQKGRMTAGELATLTGLTTGAVTGLIDRLENKRLVKRVFAENDRRKVFIEPNNKKIMALLEPLYRQFRTDTDNLFATFSSRELKVLEKYFSKAIQLMEETSARVNQ